MSIDWGKAEVISLAQGLRVINARKGLIATIFFLVILTTGLVTYFSPRWYGSVATVKVEKPEGEVSLFGSKAQAYFDPFFTLEQLEILKSKKILLQVVENEALNLCQRLGDTLADGKALTAEQACAFLGQVMLEVENTKQGTALIDIIVEAKEDPQLAADVANVIAQVYAEDRVAFAVSGQTEGIARLKSELIAQEQLVSQQRDRVEALRREFNLSGVDINVDSLAQEIENLKVLEKTLITMRVEAIGRKSRWENFKSIPSTERLKLVNSELIADANIQNLMQAYLIAEQQQVRIEGQLGVEHPQLKSALDSLQTMKTQLEALLSGYEKSLEISYLEIEAQVSKLEEQLGAARIEQIKSAQSKMRPFQEAVELLREEEQIYQTLKLTLRQREIDFQVPKKSIELLNPAEPAMLNQPSKPNWALRMLLACCVGLILSLGLAFIIEYFDTSFRSIEDMERVLGLPILGVVAKQNGLARLSQHPATSNVNTGSANVHHSRDEMGEISGLIVADSYTSALAEPFRIIQTNIELAVDSRDLSVFAVQSAGPGEGKSSTLQNLGRVMALSGQRVLLVDADLRRPTQHELLGLNKGPGFVELLTGTKHEQDVIRATGVPGLDVITSGERRFSLNVLHGTRLKVLIAQLAQQYDKILFDSPPILGVSDAAVIASVVDGVLLVVQHRRNPQSMTQRAKTIIDKSDGRILGLVLNQVPAAGMADYNYYTSSYAYYGTVLDDSVDEQREETLAKDEKERFTLVE